MNLSFKKFDNLLLYLSLKVGVHFMNSQHLRLKWHFEKLDKYGPILPKKANHGSLFSRSVSKLNGQIIWCTTVFMIMNAHAEHGKS